MTEDDPPRRPAADARVLAVRLSALGDVVFAMPAVTALRSLVPNGRLDWLTEDRHAALLDGFPGLDEVISFPRRRWGRRGGLRALARHLRDLRRRRYDWVLDFQGNLKSVLQLLPLRRAVRVGFDRPAAREGSWRFLDLRVPDPGRVSRVERDLALVRVLGWQGPAPTPGRWPVRADPPPPADGPRILLHTTVTDYGRDKEWPRTHWLELIGRLGDRGLRSELLWTEDRLPIVRDLAEASRGLARLAPPTPTLADLMALCDSAAVLVGTDSGPLHLAAIRGTAVVGLYGPTDPVRYAPPGPRTRILTALEPDQPPPPRDRSRRSPWMDALSADRVAAAVDELLDLS
ncbi:MAG: hypothetical protein D6702_09055, partial [Planctomycetota bacterium]